MLTFLSKILLAIDPSQPLENVPEDNKDTSAKTGETGEADATPMQTGKQPNP